MHKDAEGLGPLIHDVARIFSRYWDYCTRATVGYTRMHCRVLFHLYRNGPMRPVEIAEILDLTPMAMTGLIDRMVAKNLVRREETEGDRRSYRLAIAEPATLDVKRILREYRSAEDQLLVGFSAGDKQLLRGMLDRMRSNIGDAILPEIAKGKIAKNKSDLSNQKVSRARVAKRGRA